MKHRVMIVDDEYEIRQAMSELVQWEALGFEWVGEAENGIEALELLGKGSVDVLITDIKMPYMDGIELAEKIREISPLTKIIFLSGFDEFKYAQSGIKLNVFDFLLKPVSLTELQQVMSRLKDVLVEEIEQATNYAALQLGYMEELAVLKTGFLISLMTDDETFDVPEEQIQKLVNYYQLTLKGPRYLILVIRIDTIPYYQEGRKDNLALRQYSLTDKIKQIITKFVMGEIFSFSANIVCLLSDEGQQLELFQDIIVKEIQETARQFYQMSVKIGISLEYGRLNLSKRGFEEAVKALNFPKNRQLSRPQVTLNARYPLEAHIEKKLTFLLLSHDPGALSVLLEQVLQEAQSQGEHVWQLVIKHLSVCLQRLALEQSRELAMNSIVDNQELVDHDMIQKQLVAAFIRLQASLSDQQQTVAAEIGQGAYRHLLEHYDDSTLSLASVAKHFAVSRNYFSSLFKQTNQQSFTEALGQIRMEKAQELLLGTTKRIMEIAHAVGFADQHYFSYAYKKYYGSSPKATRQKLKTSHLHKE